MWVGFGLLGEREGCTRQAGRQVFFFFCLFVYASTVREREGEGKGGEEVFKRTGRVMR